MWIRFSKIFDRIAYNQFSKFVEDNDVLPLAQFGFLLYDYFADWNQCVLYDGLYSSFMGISQESIQGSLYTSLIGSDVKNCKCHDTLLFYSFERKSLREAVGISNSDLEKNLNFLHRMVFISIQSKHPQLCLLIGIVVRVWKN